MKKRFWGFKFNLTWGLTNEKREIGFFVCAGLFQRFLRTSMIATAAAIIAAIIPPVIGRKY